MLTLINQIIDLLLKHWQLDLHGVEQNGLIMQTKLPMLQIAKHMTMLNHVSCMTVVIQT